MHGEGKRMRGSSTKGRGGLEKVFEFHELLATGFFCVYGVLDVLGAVLCSYVR